MTDLFSQFVVQRAIPDAVIGGLMTGRYQLHGGVVRWAAGTPHAGQIVQHLIPAVSSQRDFLNVFSPTLQLQSMSAFSPYSLVGSLQSAALLSRQVLRLTASTMYLSGLNLMMTAVGFSSLNQHVARLESHLESIQEQVTEIREFLERKQRAAFKVALENLMYMHEVEQAENRHVLLHNARQTLAELYHQSAEMLGEGSTIEGMMAQEEFFTLAAIARARCTAELAMFDTAEREMQEAVEIWQERMQATAAQLIGDDPERFFGGDYVDEVPTASLLEWLDFIEGKQRGYEWIDILRRVKPKSGERTLMGWIPRTGSRKEAVEHDKTRIAPAMHKIVARHKTLNGYAAQYTMLAEYRTPPSQFQEALQALDPALAVDGYLVLKPRHAA